MSEAGPPTYPFDFSLLREGDVEPLLGKRIASLIGGDSDYIVFLDDESYVYWDMNDNTLITKYGDAINRVAVLEAIEIDHLTPGQLETFRRMVGEGVARLCEQNESAASASFDRAEEWIRARNQETARLWYLKAAAVTASPFVLALLSMILWREPLRAWLGVAVFDVVAGGCAGAIGALLSVLQRTRTTHVDLSAGRRIHQVEGGASILAGLLGAALFALGIKARLVLGSVEAPYAFATLLAFCMVAGLSERLVPSFVQSVEGQAAPKPD
jgi:hypothetical protein